MSKLLVELKYGRNFRDYYLERQSFSEAEHRREIWVGLGIMAQFILVCFGALLLPIVHLPIWFVAIVLSSVLVLSGLISLWKQQRVYSSFDRWLKYNKRM